MKSKKIFFAFIISTISIIFIAFLSAFIFVKTQIKPVSSLQEETPVQFEISYGESTRKIATNLQNKNLIKNADLFYYFVRYPKLFDIFEKSDLQKEIFVLKLLRLSRLCGCGAMKKSPRGKSELHEAGCRLTAGEGDFKESATEKNRPKG